MSSPSLDARPARNRFVAVMYASACLPHALLIDATLVAAALTLLGAGPVVVGTAGLASNLGSVLSSVAAPFLMPLFRSRTRMVIATSAAVCVGLAGMAAALLVRPAEAAIACLVSGWTVCQMAWGARALPWADLMRQEVPREVRIGHVARSAVLSLLATAAASYGVKTLLDSSTPFPTSYLVVFLGAAGSAALGLVAVAALHRESAPGGAGGPVSFLRAAVRDLSGLRRNPGVALALGSGLFYLLTCFTAGLYVSSGYLRNPAEMARIFGAALVIRTLVKALAYYLAGRVATRVGNKVVLFAICVAGAIAPITSLFLPFRFYTLVLISTNLMPMFEPFIINIVMNLSKDDEFPGRYTLYNLLRFPLSLLLPFLGVLVEHAMPVLDVLVLVCLAAAALLVARLPREADRN
jgi:hypothetical protein